jgi:hypothetical protein
MFLGAIGSFASNAGGAVLGAGSSMVESVASVVEDFPLAAAVLVGVAAFELSGSKSDSSSSSSSSSGKPDNVGRNVDTTA